MKLLEGFLISLNIFFISQIFDFVFEYDTLKKFSKEELYYHGLYSIILNILIISPIIYSFGYNMIINDNAKFQLIHVFSIIILQNLGYYFAHYMMHKRFYHVHEFHHRFKKYILPSSSFAVSVSEYIFAYLLPLFLGSIIVNPNSHSFIIASYIISIFNIIIHTQTLKNSNWIPFLVSPKKHITHHEVKNRNYAAPLLDIDLFLKKIFK